MKLSKEQLKNLIGSGGGCDWNVDPYKEEKYEHFKSSVLNSLRDGTLEIEGYERVQWTRFDPQDSDTFPPFGRYLCVRTDGGEVGVTYRSSRCNDEIFASLPHDMEYWRPLPKPPVETERQQMNYKKMTLEELEHEMCKQLKKENKKLRKRIEELEQGDKWTKFEPDDESTFPPREGMYLVCRGVEPYFREAKFHGEKVGFGDTCIILWRPLPKLPLEIDVRYIREDRPECFSYDRKV